MYTIKLTDTYQDFPTVFNLALSASLSEFNIEFDGIHSFLGKDDMFSIAGFNISGGNLEYSDWVTVNQTINFILNELDISVRVQNERYMIRDGTNELTNYRRRSKYV